MKNIFLLCALFVTSSPTVAWAGDLVSHFVSDSVEKPKVDAAYWASIEPVSVPLLAQPMWNPRPKETTTTAVEVKSVHDSRWISFHLSWTDSELSEAGKLGEYSDAIAIQFPGKEKEVPPPVFMGAKDDPVHIYHWRAQYQRDEERGKPEMADLYPNASIDLYPLEPIAGGSYNEASADAREQFSPAKAAGNPQAYPKRALDEIIAEGFGTSTVQKGGDSSARGQYKNGKWSVVITRALDSKGRSVLSLGKKSFMAFAIWQGGKGEVGSRKSVTMMWTPFTITKKD